MTDISIFSSNMKHKLPVPCLASTATSSTSLIAQFTGATFISPIRRVWSGGIGGNCASKGGKGARAGWAVRNTRPKW